MSDIDSNKEKALTAALSQIERQFGKGAMMRLGDSPQEKIPSISTGGAATNAITNTLVAVRRVGIIITPNQPI